ncbi:MAG TPA: hypothetical protein VGS58_00785 [Candidatus Sulfopaludibacter sp.]|nr:hypothetical protein [Candidatus Sulfopaludibacter sp.]
MPVAKITGQGLSAIALSVALLWGCWMQEQALIRRERAERARVLRDLRQLQNTPTPVFRPEQPAPRPSHVTAG